MVITFRPFGTTHRSRLQYSNNPRSPNVTHSVRCIYRTVKYFPLCCNNIEKLPIKIQTLFHNYIKSILRIITQDIITLTDTLLNRLFQSGQ